MKLLCFQIHPVAPKIVPGRSSRQWMDATESRHAYRCLPLTIANSMGWEILLPARVTATWNGGAEIADLTVEVDDFGGESHPFARSHFGFGILTFSSGYLFRTDPGIALWVRGIPNQPKDGIAPLEELVETDWLDFTFTMNWQFTRPGSITFEKDEPFCFITPIAYHALDNVIPEIIPIAENRELATKYRAYSEARKDFNTRFTNKDPEILRQGWQKWYMRGEPQSGGPPYPSHLSKLRLAAPIAHPSVEDGAEAERPQSGSDLPQADLTVESDPVLD